MKKSGFLKYKLHEDFTAQSSLKMYGSTCDGMLSPPKVVHIGCFLLLFSACTGLKLQSNSHSGTNRFPQLSGACNAYKRI